MSPSPKKFKVSPAAKRLAKLIREGKTMSEAIQLVYPPKEPKG